jgi:hypothetical protein
MPGTRDPSAVRSNSYLRCRTSADPGSNALQWSDRSGYFKLDTTKPGSIVATDKHYVPCRFGVYDLELDRDMFVHLPDLFLIPAAYADLEVVCPAEDKPPDGLNFLVEWIPNEENATAWDEKFIQQFNGGWFEFLYRGYHQTDRPCRIFIPANQDIRLKLTVHHDDKWGGLEIPEKLNVGHGDSIDLGQVTLSPTMPVGIQVLDARGEPLPGIPVSLVIGNAWQRSHMTDAAGAAFYGTPPDMGLKVGVNGPSDKMGRPLCDPVSRDIRVSGKEKEMPMFPLTLPDVFLEALRNDGQ